MARNQWDDQDDDDDDAQVDDSTLLRQLRKQLKEAQKANTERDAELATLRGVTRERSLSEVLSQKGLNSKVAKLYPGDAEATSEAVEAWLSEYGDVFGLQTEAPADSNVDAASQAAHERMADSAAGSAAPGRESDAAARIAAAKNPEELLAFLSGN